jgi:hypothetical protein
MNGLRIWAVGACLVLPAVLLSGIGAAASARRPLITERSAGPVRIGMTIAAARRALPGLAFRRTTNGEGLALVSVERGRKPVMILFADEQDPGKPLDPKAKVAVIEVKDPAYATRAGVRVGMLLSQAERRYGRVTKLAISEIEGHEFADFRRLPGGLLIEVGAANGARAGRYPPGRDAPGSSTTKYVPSARVISIHVMGRPRM